MPWTKVQEKCPAEPERTRVKATDSTEDVGAEGAKGEMEAMEAAAKAAHIRRYGLSGSDSPRLCCSIICARDLLYNGITAFCMLHPTFETHAGQAP